MNTVKSNDQNRNLQQDWIELRVENLCRNGHFGSEFLRQMEWTLKES